MEQPPEDTSENNTETGSTAGTEAAQEEAEEAEETEDTNYAIQQTTKQTEEDLGQNKTIKPQEFLDNLKYETAKTMEYLILENAYNNNLCSDVSVINLVKYYTDKK